MMAGKWVKQAATGSDAEDFDAFCDAGELIGGMSEDYTDDNTTERAGTTTVDGAPALNLKVKETDGVSTVSVATKGRPYILRLAGTGKDKDTVAFSEFGVPVKAAPPAGKVIDLDSL
jgi:hypothetical protein